MNSNRIELRQKKVFIWDFDGCFCDTEPLHYEAYNYAFAQFGHAINEARYYEIFTHLGDGAQHEIATYNLECSPHDIKVLKDKKYQEIIYSRVVPAFPEIKSILELSSALGIKHTIASNSPSDQIRHILEQNNLLSFVQTIYGPNDGIKRKPAPDLFLMAMNSLAAKHDECVVLEDSSRGLYSASLAKIETLWIKTRYNSSLSTEQPFHWRLSHAELYACLLAQNS